MKEDGEWPRPIMLSPYALCSLGAMFVSFFDDFSPNYSTYLPT